MFEVHRCGYDGRHQPPFQMLWPQGAGDYILLLVKTPAYFAMCDEAQDGIEAGDRGQTTKKEPCLIYTEPGTVALFPPTAYVCYGARGQDYQDDWLHFTISPDDPFLEELQLPMGQPFSVPDIAELSRYLRLIVRQSYAQDLHRGQVLDALMRALFLRLDAQRRERSDSTAWHKHYAALRILRADIYNRPERDWQVARMAEQVYMSPSYFQHLYKTFFGVPCMQDVMRARLDHAKFLLQTTDMKVKAVAGLCGYESELHFMRQFKLCEGMTPTQYRRLT